MAKWWFLTFKGAFFLQLLRLRGTLHATCTKARSSPFQRPRSSNALSGDAYVSRSDVELKDYTGAVAKQGGADQRDSPLSSWLLCKPRPPLNPHQKTMQNDCRRCFLHVCMHPFLSLSHSCLFMFASGVKAATQSTCLISYVALR